MARTAAAETAIAPKALEELYTTMCRIRGFEEWTSELFQSGFVKGTAHSYIGPEAIAAPFPTSRASNRWSLLFTCVT